MGLEPTTLYTLDRALYQLSYRGSSAGWAQISHLIVHLMNRLTINTCMCMCTCTKLIYIHVYASHTLYVYMRTLYTCMCYNIIYTYPTYIKLYVQLTLAKHKGDMLGMMVMESGYGSALPTPVIAHLSKMGSAARSGQLNIGDQIIAINSINMVGMPVKVCVEQLKVSRDSVTCKTTHINIYKHVHVTRKVTAFRLVSHKLYVVSYLLHVCTCIILYNVYALSTAFLYYLPPSLSPFFSTSEMPLPERGEDDGGVMPHSGGHHYSAP